MCTFRVKKLNFLLLLVVVRFDMRLKLIFLLVSIISQVCSTFPLFCLENEQEPKIIQRTDFQKKLSVKQLTNAKDGQLKGYSTFSLNVSGQLIFCHIANDRLKPRVICH